MNNTNWNDKQQVLVSVTKYGYALEYASKDLKNNKEIVLAAVNQNGFALFYASENLKNDLELLSLLHQFYNLPENKIEYVNIKKWLAERMKTRDILWNKI